MSVGPLPESSCPCGSVFHDLPASAQVTSDNGKVWLKKLERDRMACHTANQAVTEAGKADSSLASIPHSVQQVQETAEKAKDEHLHTLFKDRWVQSSHSREGSTRPSDQPGRDGGTRYSSRGLHVNVPSHSDTADPTTGPEGSARQRLRHLLGRR